MALKCTKAFSADTRCSELEKKIVHLSVAIEDRSESIDLLIQAIEDVDKDSERQRQHQNAELRQMYEQTSDQYGKELSVLKQKCSESIEEKKALASELERLTEERRIEEEKLSAALDQIHNRTEERIQQEKKKWMDGKVKREQQWMSSKVQQVRRATLEALQPELKRLLDSQRLEMEEIKAEQDSKMKYQELEAQRNFESKLSEYKIESNSRTRVIVAKRKEEWMEQIASLRQSFTDQMKGTLLPNDSIEDTLRKEYNEARNDLEDKHSRNMDRVTEARDRRKKELNLSLQEKLKELDEKMRKELESIEKDDASRKEIWRNKKKASLQKEFDESVRSMHQLVIAERDRNIDLAIRSNQKNETDFQQSFATTSAEKKSSVESEFSKQLKCVEEEISSKQKQLRASASTIASLTQKVQNSKDQVDISERKIEKVRKRIAQIRENSIEKNAVGEISDPQSVGDQLCSFNAETKIYRRKLQVAQEKLRKINDSLMNFDMYVFF